MNLDKKLTIVIFCTLISYCLGMQTTMESNIIEGKSDFILFTDDGLQLNINKDNGFGVSLKIGKLDTNLGSIPLVKFEEVIENNNAPNLLDGSDFDTQGHNEDEKCSDNGWYFVLGGDKAPTQTVSLNQKQPKPLVLSGVCKAELIPAGSGWAVGWQNKNLALNVYGTYADGQEMPEQSAYFGQYTHGLQFNKKVLCPNRPLSQVRIAASCGIKGSKAWFKDIALKEAEYSTTSPSSSCQRTEHSVVQEFNLERSQLAGYLAYQVLEEGIQIRCNFKSLKKVDRAISGYITIPIDAIGGVWYDDFRTSRKIEEGLLYRNSSWFGLGRDGYGSKYPIGCIETPQGEGLAIATSIDEPRVFQVEYDANKKELRIRYDFGLSPDGGTWANRASFTALIFRYDAKDGFRAATERYHSIYKWAYKKRVKKEGLWMAFLNPYQVVGSISDFHFQFIEAISSVGWGSQKGQYWFRYVEPWIMHQEAPAHSMFSEITGSVDPQLAIKLAKKNSENHDMNFPDEKRQKYRGFLGSYIEDEWGQPQGYFYRNEKGRNENMMIVNPNVNLPPADGAHFTSGAWDTEVISEDIKIWKQWHLDGWTFQRSHSRVSGEIDMDDKASGRQSLRFDPIESRSYWEQYFKGIVQRVLLKTDSEKEFSFSFKAKCTDMEKDGTPMKWDICFLPKDEQAEVFSYSLNNLTADWKKYHYDITLKQNPFSVEALLMERWFYDPATFWFDDVCLTVKGSDENLLANGGFEKARMMKGDVHGVYMDTIECYNNLNRRRSHWAYSLFPLTFGCAREPGINQVFSNTEFAKKTAEKAWSRDLLMMANSLPFTCFSAPYCDVMGIEESWIQGDKWSPKSDESFNFCRFVSRAKPYGLLQMSDLTVEQMYLYMKRCLFYGVFPGHQSVSKVDGRWYWYNPVRIESHRPVYKKYMPILIEITKAGWQPVTLACSGNENIWIERYGDGNNIYFTLFNPSNKIQEGMIAFDPKTGITSESKIAELTNNKIYDANSVGYETARRFNIGPEDVLVLKIQKK